MTFINFCEKNVRSVPTYLEWHVHDETGDQPVQSLAIALLRQGQNAEVMGCSDKNTHIICTFILYSTCA